MVVLHRWVEKSGHCGEEHGLWPYWKLNCDSLLVLPITYCYKPWIYYRHSKGRKTSEACIRFLVVIYAVKVDTCSMRCPDSPWLHSCSPSSISLCTLAVFCVKNLEIYTNKILLLPTACIIMASTTSFYIIRFPISQEGRTAM